MEKITAIQVLDVPVHPYSMDAAVQYLDDKIQEQKHSFVVTANAEIIMMCQDDAEYKNILTNVADLVLPDGAGTVWAGRQLGYAVPERVAGFDLFNRLLNLAAEKGYRVFFFGASPGIAEAAKKKAESLYPGVTVVGCRDGYFKDSDNKSIIDAINNKTITNAMIVGVISNNANAYALTRAKDNGIEAVCVSPKDYEDRDEFNDALLAKVNEFKPDLIVLAGFLVKIPEKMVHEYSHRIINIHPSLIPSICGVGYYGLHVHEEALKKGVKVTGATVHYVDEGMDTGEIIFQKAVDVLDTDTPQTLQRRVMEQAEWKLLPAAINMIANKDTDKQTD